MLKILMIVLLLGVAYRLFFPPNKQIGTHNDLQEPDEYIDYEEVDNEETNQ